MTAEGVRRFAAVVEHFRRMTRGGIPDFDAAYRRLKNGIATAQATGELTAAEAALLNDYDDFIAHEGLEETAPPAVHDLRRSLLLTPEGPEYGRVTADAEAAIKSQRLGPKGEGYLRKAYAKRMAASLFNVLEPPAVEVPVEEMLPKVPPGWTPILMSYREWGILERLESVTMFQHGLTMRKPGQHHLTIDFNGGPDAQGESSFLQIDVAQKEMTG